MILFIISVQAVLAQPVLDVVGDLPVVQLLEHEVAVAGDADGGQVNDGGVATHSTRHTPLPALTSLWGAVGRK